MNLKLKSFFNETHMCIYIIYMHIYTNTYLTNKIDKNKIVSHFIFYGVLFRSKYLTYISIIYSFFSFKIFDFTNSVRNFVQYKNPYFLVLYICSSSKSSV